MGWKCGWVFLLQERIFFSGCAGMWERQLVRLGVIIVAWIFIIHQLTTVRKRAERVSDYRTVWLCSSVWSWRAEEPCPLISWKCDEASGTIKSGACGAYGADCFQLLADSHTDRHGSAMSEVGGRKQGCFFGFHLTHCVNLYKHQRGNLRQILSRKRCMNSVGTVALWPWTWTHKSWTF